MRKPAHMKPHLRANLRAFADQPPWGRLSESEMAQLSALREPAGRPSHWGECEDRSLARDAAAERPSTELR